MPSIVGPARYMRPRKLRTNARTPINMAVAEWRERQRRGNREVPEREAVPPPEFGPPLEPLEPEELPGDLAWAWERSRVLLLSEHFARLVLDRHVDAGAMPDSVMHFVHNAHALAEVALMLRLTWPHLYPDDESDPDGRTAWTEADAAEMGLSPYRPRRPRKRTPANLPGCDWRDGAGEACKLLRRKGHRYCPTHEERVRQALRGEGG